MDVLMMVILDYLKNVLNNDQEFRSVIKDWNARLLIRILPDIDIPYIYRVFLEIWNGKVVEFTLLEPDDKVEADIIVEMPISIYEGILRGEVGTTKAFLFGKIKIKGKKGELMKRRKALDKLNDLMRGMIFGEDAITATRHVFRRVTTF